MSILVFILTLFPSYSFAQENVLLAALAKVGEKGAQTTLTTRDLQIGLFFNEQESFLQAFEDRRDPLKEMVWEELIYIEAQKVLLQDITAANVKDFVANFKKKLGADKLWTQLHVSDRELAAAAKRRIAARRLVNLKMGSKDLISISSEEIESYYIQNRNQLGQRPISEVRDKILASLQNVKAQERFKDWINAITRTRGVVYYSGYKIQ